ncbi:hypothetical protein JOD21_001906 [Jeotgalibacillus terrae]|nr:hypothetical protein [Jeotgalibacillus terrae]
MSEKSGFSKGCVLGVLFTAPFWVLLIVLIKKVL